MTADQVKSARTIAALIDDYQSNPARWPERKATRDDFGQLLAKMREKNGNQTAIRFDRPALIQIRDRVATT